MARKPDPIKLDSLHPVIGQGSNDEVLNMSFVLEWKGINILVFMHGVAVYILIPHDTSLRTEIVKSEREILNCICEEMGHDFKSLTMMQTYLH